MTSASYYSLVIVALVVGVALLWLLIFRAVDRWQATYDLRRELEHVAKSVLEPILARVGPRTDNEVRELQVRLVQAGSRDIGAMRRFAHLRLLCLANSLLATGLLVALGFDVGQVMVLGSGVVAIGVFAPTMWLSQRIRSRQEAIARAMPTTVDLVTLCLEAGLSVEQAFQRVVAELSDVHPVMAEEAGIMVGEMAAGVPFAQAIKRMAERVGLAELILLARLISQGATLGASLTRTLREYSESAHHRRMLGLDERAGRLSAATTLPVTLCLLPAALLMVIGPSLVVIVRSLNR